MRASQKTWTPEEIQYLKDNYGTVPITEIAKYLGRNASGVYGALNRYGINSPSLWKEEEDEFLKQNYRSTRYKDLAHHLGRSEKSIQCRIHTLGLITWNTSKNWSNEEIQFLKDNINSMSYGDISIRLGRTVGSISNKAYELKLTKDSFKARVLKLEQQMFIVQNCHKMTDQVLADKFGVDVKAIAAVRKKYGVIKTPYRSNSSYIEDTVGSLLTQYGIYFTKHAKLDQFEVDFLIGSSQVIEVYGDYYHCNPFVYGDGPKDESQVRYIVNDYYKKCYLLSRGYRVLYIWEKDLNDSIEEVEQQILEFCRPGWKRPGV